MTSPGTDTRNSALCPAVFTNAGTTTAGAGAGTMAYAANYWCSNGNFRLGGTPATPPTNLTLGAAEDKFTEFMLIACRQTLSICGDAQVTVASGSDFSRNVGSNAEAGSGTFNTEATRK